MKIFIKVKTGSKKEHIIPLGENKYKIEVKARPVEGQANEAIISAIADFFKIPKARIKIVRGFKSKFKVLEINT